MTSAYDVFLKAHQQQYIERLNGNANSTLTNAIGVAVYWLEDHREMSLADFIAKIDDPLFVSNIRNLGPRRVELIKQYITTRSNP